MRRVSISLLLVSTSIGWAAAQSADAGPNVVEQAVPATITASSEWPDFLGHTIQVHQSLTLNSKGKYVYRFSEQTEKTQQYHRAYCAEFGMDPATGEAITEGEGASAFHCSSANVSSDPEAFKSTDYVFASAPNGQASVGQNFFATGVVRFRSSVPGEVRGSVQVDNRRCSTYYNKFFDSAFDGQHVAGINCIEMTQRSLNTGMEGCIPKTCGSNAGTIDVR